MRNYYKLRNLKYEESYDKIVDEEKSMRERKKKILSRIIKLNEFRVRNGNRDTNAAPSKGDRSIFQKRNRGNRCNRHDRPPQVAAGRFYVHRSSKPTVWNFVLPVPGRAPKFRPNKGYNQLIRRGSNEKKPIRNIRILYRTSTLPFDRFLHRFYLDGFENEGKKK